MTLKNLNIKLIVKELEKAYNSQNKSFDAFKYNEIKYLILSHLHAPKNISQAGMEMFTATFLRRFHHEEINEENFNRLFKETKKEYFDQKEISYTLITSISVNYLPFRKIKINNSLIRITGKNFPKKFVKSRRELLIRNRKKEEDNKFIKVSIETKGKNYLDAFEQAYFDFNIFRAMLCFSLNSFTEISLSNGNSKAINKIQFGEFHTLHLSETGETIKGGEYWFETSLKERITRFPTEDIEVRKKAIESWLNRFNKCQREHKNKLGEVLNLYVDAFDETNKQTCFLKGWITLECLLGTFDNELIIKRCVSIFKEKDREYQRQILNGLRKTRNLIVHENDNRINSLVNCYHVQRYIRGILMYNNLKYWKVIKNQEEALKLLDYRLQSNKVLESETKVIEKIKQIKKYEN